jgi:hypothetical protein
LLATPNVAAPPLESWGFDAAVVELPPPPHAAIAATLRAPAATPPIRRVNLVRVMLVSFGRV